MPEKKSPEEVPAEEVVHPRVEGSFSLVGRWSLLPAVGFLRRKTRAKHCSKAL